MTGGRAAPGRDVVERSWPEARCGWGRDEAW